MMVQIDAFISAIRANRSGTGTPEKARITADYEAANVLSSVEFDIPHEEARRYWVGQKLTIRISYVVRRQRGRELDEQRRLDER